MADVEVKFDEAKLRRIQLMLRDIPRQMPRVVSSAINKTAAMARTQVVRRIASEVGVKQKRIKQRVTLQKATFTCWRARIGIGARRLPLMAFGARQKKKGVSYKIEKSGPRKTLKSAFIATMKTGHEGVFMRGGPRRLPIFERFGPSIGQVFENAPAVAKEVTRSAYVNLQRHIDSQIARALSKLKRGAAA